jgi:hypothetical protein
MKFAEVVGERVELKMHGVGRKGMAWQPRPLDHGLALLDALLRRTTLIVEGDDALRRAGQVGGDEADTWVKLTRMPLDLGHDTPRLFPALRLVAEAGKVAADLVRRPPDRALE